jgi:branched-chain amino acid transport system ATP-binding protein
MLDEPSEGLAPIIVSQIGGLLRELSRTQGLAVLLTEQNHRFALRIADRAYFLEKGHIVFEGSAVEASDDDVIHRFLAV